MTVLVLLYWNDSNQMLLTHSCGKVTFEQQVNNLEISLLE